VLESPKIKPPLELLSVPIIFAPFAIVFLHPIVIPACAAWQNPMLIDLY
jgi:hypothetical protein